MFSGYKTYAASAGLALLAILQAILSEPSVANWLSSGKDVLLAAAIAALRIALKNGNLDGLADLFAALMELIRQAKTPQPVPPVFNEPSGPDFNPFVVSSQSSEIVTGPGGEVYRNDSSIAAGPTHGQSPLGRVVMGGQLSEQYPLTPGSGNPLLPLLAFLLLAGTASAAGPKAIINGPATAVPGELVTLDASGSQGENLRFRWSVQPDQPGRDALTLGA